MIPGLRLGGTETMLYKLLQNTERSSISPTVISLKGRGVCGDKIERLEIPLVVAGMKGKIPGLHTMIQLWKVTRELQPDIIQGWMYHGNIAATVLSFFLSKKTPVIWNIRHSLDSLEKERRLTKWSIHLNQKWSGHPKVVLFNSMTSLEQHVKFGFTKNNVRWIPNGFNTEKFTPRPDLRDEMRKRLGFSERHVVLGIVARYHEVKDHDNFLRAGAILIGNNPDIRLFLVGSGLDESNIALNKLIHELGIENNVVLLGGQDKIETLLCALDVMVLSSYSEAFPNVIGEAMSATVPCVATDVGDVRRIIGKSGVVVPARSPEKLADGINKIIKMPSQARARLSEQARAQIVKNFSMKTIAKQYNDIYQNIFLDSMLETGRDL